MTEMSMVSQLTAFSLTKHSVFAKIKVLSGVLVGGPVWPTQLGRWEPMCNISNNHLISKEEK